MPDQTFSYTGAVQKWTVPAGVRRVTLEAWGAEGGRVHSGATRRYGGYAKGDAFVTPGETLLVYVGQYPGIGIPVPGGWNGGGEPGLFSDSWGAGLMDAAGGGGASDVRRGGNALSNRIIVAGGAGGQAAPDAYADPPEGVRRGGHGGAATGERGDGGSGSTGGYGGSQSAGGSLNGALGQGGDGEWGYMDMNAFEENSSGGGGGGGYYGGGGGGANFPQGRGGGGGSNYVTGLVGSTTSTRGVKSSHGQVKITWDTPPAETESPFPSTISGVNEGSVQLSDGSTVFLQVDKSGNNQTGIGGPPSGGSHSNTNFGTVFEVKQYGLVLNSCTINASATGSITVRVAHYLGNGIVGQQIGSRFANIMSTGEQTFTFNSIRTPRPGLYIIYKEESSPSLMRTNDNFDFSAHQNDYIQPIEGAQAGGPIYQRLYYFFNLNVSIPTVDIKRVTPDQTVTTIDTFPTSAVETQALKFHAQYAQSIAMCRDADDNLYFVGARGNHNTQTNVIAYTKTAPTTWVRQGTRFFGSNSTVVDPVGHSVVWCNAGDGNGAKGMLLAAWSSGLTGETKFALVHAQEALTGDALTQADVGTNPSWLVPTSAHMNPRGVGISLATESFGSSKIGAFAWSVSGQNGHAQMATFNADLSIWGVSVDTSLTNFDFEEQHRARIVGTEDGFAAVWNDGDNLLVKKFNSATEHQVLDAKYFDAVWISQTGMVWIYYGESEGTTYRIKRLSYDPSADVLNDNLEDFQAFPWQGGWINVVRAPNNISVPKYVEIHINRSQMGAVPL